MVDCCTVQCGILCVVVVVVRILGTTPRRRKTLKRENQTETGLFTNKSFFSDRALLCTSCNLHFLPSVFFSCLNA